MEAPEFEGVLDDLQGLADETAFRDLLERAGLIAEMTQTPGWEVFCDYMIALTTNAQTKILGGYCRSIEEYRTLTGRVNGIREVLQAPGRLQNQILAMRVDAEEQADVDSGLAT